MNWPAGCVFLVITTAVVSWLITNFISMIFGVLSKTMKLATIFKVKNSVYLFFVFGISAFVIYSKHLEGIEASIFEISAAAVSMLLFAYNCMKKTVYFGNGLKTILLSSNIYDMIFSCLIGCVAGLYVYTLVDFGEASIEILGIVPFLIFFFILAIVSGGYASLYVSRTKFNVLVMQAIKDSESKTSRH